MKCKLVLTMLAVAALVCGLCGSSQAVDTTITFGTGAGAVQLTTGADYFEGDYTYSTGSTTEYLIAPSYYDESNYFEGYSVVDWGLNAPMVITHTNSEAFTVKSITVGAYSDHAKIIVTGDVDGGGTVTDTIFGLVGQAVTNHLYGFHNITNLQILAVQIINSGVPIFDSIVLTDELTAIHPPTDAVLSFDGTAPNISKGFKMDIATSMVYAETGYIMTPTAGGTYFKHAAHGGAYAPFDGSVVALWDSAVDSTISFTRADGHPFNATSLALGAIGAAELDVVGNLVGGGSVTKSFTPAAGFKTTETLSGFENLTSLDMINAGGVNLSIIDDLTLEALVVPSGTVIWLR